jgi:ribosomal protein S18 acetylase RimI-like enzyme
VTVLDSNVSFRSAGVSDVTRVIEFWKRSAEDAHRPVDTPSAVEILLKCDPEALILALVGDEIVGTAIAGFDGWRCRVYRLADASEHRRRGIGGELVRRAELRFTAAGAARSEAMVLDENELAHRGWSSWGYSRQMEWRRWVKPLDDK